MNSRLARAEVGVENLKRCPHCKRTLPISEFGICRSRPDGLNLYCRDSVNIKIADSRQRLREYKAARQGKAAPVTTAKQIDLNFSPRRKARLLRKLSPVDRVLEAIRCGAKTQDEIRSATRLPKDEVGDAIAQILLYDRTIRTEVIYGTRMYFAVDDSAQTIRRQPVRLHEPRSHGVSSIYFAA
jgi:hypothetical protein